MQIPMMHPQAVLLLLTLALLGTPTIGTQEYYGSSFGTHFCITSPNGEDITAIRISKNGVRLTNVQIRYRETWSETYGIRGGTPEEFVLHPDEHFIWAYGSFIRNIRSVMLYTSRGRNVIFGQIVGTHFTVFPSKEGQVLTGLCGFYFLGGLKSIRLLWGDPQEKAGSPSSGQ